MQGDAHEQGTSIVRGVVDDPGETRSNAGTHSAANGSTDQWREPKTGRVDPGDGPAWARRVFVASQGGSRLDLARRNWPVLALIAIALGVGVGVAWLTIGRGPSEADLERQALRSNFGQLQEQVQSLSAQTATLVAAKERAEDGLAAANTRAEELSSRLDTEFGTVTARLSTLEQRQGRQPTTPARTPSASTHANTSSASKPTAPDGPVLINTFRNVEVRLLKAVRDGTTIRMDFVVTAAETDTPLRIGNDGARLNFADGTRYTKYESVSTNEWRRKYRSGFTLIADVPRRFTVEWANVRTDAAEVAVVELSGDLRHSGTGYAMKFTRVPLE